MINPYIFTGLKNVIVALLLVSWLLMMRDWKILKNLNIKQWFLLLGIGLIGGSIPFLLFFKGLTLTTGIQAAFIHKTMFIYIALLAIVFLKEKMSRNFLIAGLILFLANILLLKATPHNFGFGDSLILTATLFWAGESVLSKYMLKDLSFRIIAGARMFFGSAFIIIFLLFTNQLSLASTISFHQLGWVMITSVLLFGYISTWYMGLKYVKVSEAAVILLLATPVTMILSWILLDEALLSSQFFGIMLALVATGSIYRSMKYAKDKSVSTI